MKKSWLWITGAVVIMASFLFSDSMWRTFANRRNIAEKKQELARLEKEAVALRADIDRLQNHPETYEQLVRKELNYLRPGEKELRFVRK